MRLSGSAALLLLLSASAVHATPPRTTGFHESTRAYIGHAPVGLAVGDLNRDGSPDVACVNDDSTVTTLLGNGPGELFPQYDRLVGSTPVAVALGDLNQDGLLDLAVSSAESGTIFMMFGAGDGTIAGVAPLHGPWAPGALALVAPAGGAPDLVVADLFFQALVVARNDGAGSFQFASQLTGFLDPVSIAVGDVARDGFPDVAVADAASRAATVVNDIEQAGGTRRDQPLAGHPVAVALGDLDRDGYDDLVVATRSPSTIAVCRGSAGGVLQPAHAYPAGPAPVALALGDVDGDGRLDVALADHDDRSIEIWLGRGDGSLIKLGDVPTGAGPVALAVVDMIGDGQSDLVCANHDEGSVQVFLHEAMLTGSVRLLAPSPNPASATARLTFVLSVSTPVRLDIFDLSGRLVRRLLDGRAMPAGTHSLVWDGRTDGGDPARSGLYFVQLDAGGVEATTRLALSR